MSEIARRFERIRQTLDPRLESLNSGNEQATAWPGLIWSSLE